MSTEIDFFEPGTVEPNPESTLERLTALAKDATDLMKEIETDEAATKLKQERLDKILREYIPGIMRDLDLEDYKLKDGSKVEVKEEVKCHISEENKPDAFAWLRENNFDGIIKTNVTASFGKGEVQRAAEARAALVAAGFDQAAISESVHSSTLKAFVKERLEAGDSIPLEPFGVYEFTIAKITQPKRK